MANRAFFFRDLLVTFIGMPRDAEGNVCCDNSICNTTTHICRPITDGLSAGDIDEAEALFAQALQDIQALKAELAEGEDEA